MTDKLICLIGLLFLVYCPSFSQEWVRMMEDHNANFYETQQKFEEYWKDKKIEKGSGWKQFKRWEYFMEPRVYPSGILPNPTQAWDEHIKYTKKHHSFYNSLSKTKVSVDNWSPLGPSSWSGTSGNPGVGRINCIVVDTNGNDEIYIGAPSGGCWKSTDGGSSWYTTTDNLPILGVSSIVIDPNNSSIIYIATGDGDGGDTYSIGVLKSFDGGNTWNPTGLNWSIIQANRVSKLLIHPANSNMLLAATDNGIYRSTDSANSWSIVIGGNFRDIEFKPGDPNTVYATSDQFFKSIDNGLSFIQITNGLPLSSDVNRALISVSNAAPDYVYVLYGSSSDGGFYGLFRSVDSGNSFSLRTNSPNLFGYATNGSGIGGISWYAMAIATSHTNPEEVYVGCVNIWKSTNGGLSFNINTDWYYPSAYGYVHADIHSLEMFNSTLYCGSDGGIFKTTDNANTWTDITSGIEITQFYRMGGSATNSNIIIGGSQDNGSNLMNGSLWTHVLGGDGMEAIIDYNNPNIVYASYQNGGIMKSTNGGGNFFDITFGITEAGGWVTPYVMDPLNSSILYAGYENVWKTTDGGNNWNSISNFSFFSLLTSLAVAPSNQDYIYATSYNQISKTDNGGTTWTDVTNNLPILAITYLAIHPTDPDKIWATLSGYSGGNKVYASSNGGTSWTNYSGSLPNLPVNCIVYENGSNDGLYIGTDVGIYYRNDTLTDWQPFMYGLPNVIVNELEIHYGSGKIRAATYGRGIWESDSSITDTLNAGISRIISPTDVTLCSMDSINPVVKLKNYGLDTLTSVIIYYGIDSDTNTYNWTGSLATMTTEDIFLTTLFLSAGAHTFYASTSNPNGSADEDTINDAKQVSFNSAFGSVVTLTLITDNYGSETTWEVTDSLGAVLYSGGPYFSSSQTYTEEICLDDGCYDFTIYDSYGDGICCGYGNGSYLVEDESGDTLAFGNSFTFQEITNFCLSQPPLPIAAFTAGSTIICAGDSVTFIDQSSNSPTSWSWSFPGGTPNNSSQQNNTVIYISAGIYSVTLLVSNAYGNSTLTITDYIIVYPNPVIPDIFQNGDTLFVSSTSSSYQWYLNVNLIANATNQFHIVTQDGVYSVAITDSNGCSSISNAFIYTGVAENKIENGIFVYPNPNEGTFIIKLLQSRSGEIEVMIKNILGQTVLMSNIELGKSLHTRPINVNHLYPGIYFLYVRTERQQYVIKIVKE